MRRIPPIVIVVACVAMLGLLPTSWVAPWSGDLSSILWVPLSPIAHGGTALRLWLRPGAQPAMGTESALQADRDLYRGLWHAEQTRVQELESKLRAYEVVAGSGSHRQEVRLAAANVVSMSSDGGGVALRLNAGTLQGVSPGDAAIFGGDGLVGRIAPEVGTVSSTVLCVSSRAFGRIDAYAVPADQERAKRPVVIALQLLPDGRGALRSDVDLGTALRAGDIVRVKDSTWSSGAQGMRLGVVVEVRPKDAQPLRGEVIVRPAIDPASVSEVIIKLSGSNKS